MDEMDWSILEAELARSTLGLDLSEFQFSSIAVCPCESPEAAHEMTVFEIGLSEFLACLMVSVLRDTSTPRDSWILLRQVDPLPSPMNVTQESYCLAYKADAVGAIEEAIRRADNLRIILSAIEFAKKKQDQARSTIAIESLHKMVEQKARMRIRSRERMWSEIDHGLSSLLSDRRNPKNREPNDSVTFQRLHIGTAEESIWDVNCLVLHGHQLKNWSRQPQRFRLPPQVQVVILGHYHIKMVILRYGLWVVFGGTFLRGLSGEYTLSHLGGVEVRIHPIKHCLQFVVDRSMPS
jgi:hypothetical protein